MTDSPRCTLTLDSWSHQTKSRKFKLIPDSSPWWSRRVSSTWLPLSTSMVARLTSRISLSRTTTKLKTKIVKKAIMIKNRFKKKLNPGMQVQSFMMRTASSTGVKVVVMMMMMMMVMKRVKLKWSRVKKNHRRRKSIQNQRNLRNKIKMTVMISVVCGV